MTLVTQNRPRIFQKGGLWHAAGWGRCIPTTSFKLAREIIEYGYFNRLEEADDSTIARRKLLHAVNYAPCWRWVSQSIRWHRTVPQSTIFVQPSWRVPRSPCESGAVSTEHGTLTSATHIRHRSTVSGFSGRSPWTGRTSPTWMSTTMTMRWCGSVCGWSGSSQTVYVTSWPSCVECLRRHCGYGERTERRSTGGKRFTGFSKRHTR